MAIDDAPIFTLVYYDKIPLDEDIARFRLYRLGITLKEAFQSIQEEVDVGRRRPAEAKRPERS